VRGVAVIGNLARDVVDGGPPRVGGAPYHAARALRLLGGRTRIVARCAEHDRPTLLPPLVALGVPVTFVPALSTAAFDIRYRGESRSLAIADAGQPWTWEEADLVGPVDWVQLGALTRADFPPQVLAALVRGRRRLALDGQGLVRPARTGPVAPDGHFDPDVLSYVTVLKLSEGEAETLGGEDRLFGLGVPEILLTEGSRGAHLLHAGRRTHIPVRRIEGDVDPTGAGDAFLAAYVWARACGHRPLSAARHAASTAARVLELARASVVSTQSP
jgi:sugar/nucleoside kinase (ribokinase family)